MIVCVCSPVGHHVVYWSRWRALVVLIIATLLMAACADLTTQNIHPILSYNISQVSSDCMPKLDRGPLVGRAGTAGDPLVAPA